MKPGFFTNEDLAELSFAHRLCFAGLWTLADRDGRMEDRPRRIKAALFPYDAVEIDALLAGLAERGFIVRYVADGAAYLSIPTFLQHQRPKTDEHPSSIPAPLLEHPRGKALAPRIGHWDIGTLGNRTEGCADGAPAVADVAPDRESADGAVFADLWNELTTAPIARCRDVTSKRRRHIKARLTERSIESWREVFELIEASRFCRGENDRAWAASFDWVIGSPDVAVKVLEGKYDDRRPARRQLTSAFVEWNCPHSPPCGNRATCAVVAARKAS